jgi:kynurenine formamidase
MRIVDLSHAITADMPVWPGTPRPDFSELCTIARDGFAEHSIRMSSHTGTHLDAPAHIIEGGDTLDRLDIGQYHGKGILIDLRDVAGGDITREALMPFGPLIDMSEFVMLHTGWGRFWGQACYDRDYPVLTDDAASWIAGFGLKGIGIDAPSFDVPGAGSYPIHRLLLGSGILLIENLANLFLLPETGFFLSIFPLGIAGAEACPVRAIAFLPPFQ